MVIRFELISNFDSMKKFYLSIILGLILGYSNAQITNISPNTGLYGQQNLVTTISGNNLFFATASPSGNFTRARLIKTGVPLIKDNHSNSLFINNNTVITSFNLPSLVSYIGTFDLNVETSNINNYWLPGSFQILPPLVYISGTVFIDVNQNGMQDTGEPGKPNEKIFLLPDSVFAFTDNNGYYLIPTDTGMHNVRWVPASGSYYGISAGSQDSIDVNVIGAMTGNNFGLVSGFSNYTSVIDIYFPIARCVGLNAMYVSYENLGNIPYDGLVYVIYSSGMTYSNASPPPTSQNGDTLFWTVTNVLPFVSNNIIVYFSTPNTGQVINYSATINAMNGPVLEYTATDFGSKTVTCSYDPNDKAVTPEGVFAQHYTLLIDTLEYLIRFQNTGNDTAFNVIIRDNLDSSLDVNSVRVVSSSHPVRTELLINGIMTFYFDNILLPDSNVNEPLSNGFVRFRATAKQNTPVNTVITNQAFIFFDINAPVATNTVFNTMVLVIPVTVNEMSGNNNEIKVIPNPVTDIAHIIFKNPGNDFRFLQILSSNGKEVFNDVTQTDHFVFRKNSLSAGMYLFVIYNEKKLMIARGKIIVN